MVTRWMGVLAVAMWCLAGGAAGAQDKPAKVRVDAKVNINEASKSELMKLGGVDHREVKIAFPAARAHVR
jgi:hypothetical protein